MKRRDSEVTEGTTPHILVKAETGVMRPMGGVYGTAGNHWKLRERQEQSQEPTLLAP